MALDTTAIQAIIKEKLAPMVENALENTHETWGRAKRGKAESTNTRGAKISVRVKRHAKEKWTKTEGAVFPNAHQQGYVKMSVAYTHVYRTGELTGDVKAHENDPDKLANHVSDQYADVVEALDKSINRMFFGDGTGELAKVTAINLGTRTVTCALAQTASFGTQKIEEGAELEFRTSGGALRSGGGSVFVVVESVDVANNTFTYTVADGNPNDIAATDSVVYKESYNAAIMGLAYHINDSGSYQGVTRGTANPRLNATVVPASGASLSQSYLDKLTGNMQFKTGSESTQGLEILWSTQKWAYFAIGYGLQKIDMQPGKGANTLELGFDGATYQGIPTRFDVDCPRDQIIVWHPDTIKRYELMKLGPIDMGGGLLQPKIISSQYAHAHQFFIGGMFDLGCKTPHVNARGYGLAYSAYPNGNVN